jgi:hypothetical protein
MGGNETDCTVAWEELPDGISPVREKVISNVKVLPDGNFAVS